MTRILEVNVDDIGNGGVYSLVRNIIKKKSNNPQIDIAAYEEFEKKENKEELERYGTNVYYVGYRGSYLLKFYKIYFNLKILLKNNNYDSVHIHGDVSFKLYVAARAAAASNVKKIILHSHASGVDDRGKKSFIKKGLHLYFRKKLKKYGTSFVSCSDLASKWMFPNIDITNIIKIKNGINLNDFKFNNETRELYRKKLVNISNPFIIGHIGRFSYTKNHNFIIDVFSIIANKIPHSRLLLIGEGNGKETIQNKVKELHLDDKVIFYGVCSNVNEILQAMDIFILPSFFEGLPIVGIEAQAAGLPVIYSDRITQEAKILDCVEYESIGKKDESKWANRIEKLSYHFKRDVNSIQTLKNAGFDIADTVTAFLKLYNDK